MSKQSNQRYRKEKEKEHLKKAGLEDNASGANNNGNKQDKSNQEWNVPINRVDN